MPHYVDGFVLPLPKRNLAAYQALARRACKIWLDHGALDYRECTGDDLAVETGPGFPRGIRARPRETIVFAWAVYKSRAHRDKVVAAVMRDPRVREDMAAKKMPFDMRRMLYGGFTTIAAKK